MRLSNRPQISNLLCHLDGTFQITEPEGVEPSLAFKLGHLSRVLRYHYATIPVNLHGTLHQSLRIPQSACQELSRDSPTCPAPSRRFGSAHSE